MFVRIPVINLIRVFAMCIDRRKGGIFNCYLLYPATTSVDNCRGSRVKSRGSKKKKKQFIIMFESNF